MIQIPDTLVMFFGAIGLMHLSVYTVALARYLLHYLKFKSLPKTIQEETILLLRSQIEDQDRKIQNLEKETEKMTMALLKHLS